MRKILKWKAVFLSMILLSSFANWAIAQPSESSPNAPQVSTVTNQSIFLGRIQNLEEQLTQLKEEISKSEIDLMQLKDQVSLSENTEARLIIHSKDKMGKQYILLESIYWLDGKEVARFAEETATVPVHNDLISEGKHQIEVEKLYQRKSQSLSPEQKTFRIKSSMIVTTILGKTAYVDVVAVQKDKRSSEKLALRFDVKVLPNEKLENAPVSVLEMPLKKTDAAQETSLTITVREGSNSSLTLEKQTIFIDKQKVPTINPTLVTGNGQIIFDKVMSPGEHTISSVLEYKVSGTLATLLKIKQMKLKFFDQISIKPGYKTTLYLKGYDQEASVVLLEEEFKGLTAITEELLRGEEPTAVLKKVSSHG